jgi:hypothetical protein
MCRKFVIVNFSNLKLVPSYYKLNEIIDQSFVKDFAVYKHLANENVTPAVAKMLHSIVIEDGIDINLLMIVQKK